VPVVSEPSSRAGRSRAVAAEALASRYLGVVT